MCGYETCTAAIENITVIDIRSTRSAPYYVSRLVKPCRYEGCMFVCLDESQRTLHAILECPFPQTARPYKEISACSDIPDATPQQSSSVPDDALHVVVGTALATNFPPTSAPMVVEFWSPDAHMTAIQLDPQTLTVSLLFTSDPAAVIVQTADSVNGAFFANANDSAVFSIAQYITIGAPMHISIVYPFNRLSSTIAEPPPADCDKAVAYWVHTLAAWIRHLPFLSQKAAINHPPSLNRVIGAMDPRKEITAFSHLAKMHHNSKDGLVFFVPGNIADRRNDIFFYLPNFVEGYTGSPVICPGCRRLVDFCDFAAHINISVSVIFDTAARFDIGRNIIIKREDLSECAQRVWAADIRHEIKPWYQRASSDFNPFRNMTDDTVVYGETIVTEGRSRTVAIVMQPHRCFVTCATCHQTMRNGVYGVAEHFAIDMLYANQFKRMKIHSIYGGGISLNRADLLYTNRDIMHALHNAPEETELF